MCFTCTVQQSDLVCPLNMVLQLPASAATRKEPPEAFAMHTSLRIIVNLSLAAVIHFYDINIPFNSALASSQPSQKHQFARSCMSRLPHNENLSAVHQDQ